MELNIKSPLPEVLQALSGTWDLSSSDGWKVLESGKMRMFKKLVKGATPLPDKFIKSRTEITPYLLFNKDSMTGGVIGLQDTAIEVDGLLIIIQF